MKKLILYAIILTLIPLSVFGITLSIDEFTSLTKGDKEISSYGATTLMVPNGGTGATSFTAGECLYGNGTDAIYSDSCAAGSMTALPLGNIYVGNASNQAEATSSLYITGAGNVGIGTTAPITVLEVDGVITATGGNSTNWNTAYGWGNHADAGYLSETLPNTQIYVGNASNQATATSSLTVSSAGVVGIDKSILFNNSYTVTGNEATGTMFYDSSNMTLSVALGNDVVGQMFEEMFQVVQNDTGDTITNGTPVSFEGSIGNSGNFRAQKDMATTTYPDYYYIGLLTENCIDGATCKVTTRGKIRGIQTNGANYGQTWSDGDLLYRSTSTPGYLTNIEPSAPYSGIPVALVISAHASNGTIEVKPSSPSRISQMNDVDGTALTEDGQFLVWNNTNQYYDPNYNINDYLTETFTSATSTEVLHINEICNTNGECWNGPGVSGSQIIFYPHNSDADIATYENMFTYPDGVTPIDESCAANTAVDGGYCTIDTYISTTSDISILNYPAGTTRIHAYTYVSSAAGTTYLVIDGYKRDSLGVETFLGQATTTEINQLSVAESIASFSGGVDVPFNADGSDRLVVLVRGWTSSASNVTVHWTYQNSGFYSQIETPITSLDLGIAHVYANETITGDWTHTGLLTLGDLLSTNATTTNLTVTSNSKLGTIISGTWNGTAIDISSYTNLTVTAEGLTLSGDAIVLTAGYAIASSTRLAQHDTAYSWGNHAGLYDPIGQATSTLSSHTSTYNHDNYDTAYGWGNHATAGYMSNATTSLPLVTKVNQPFSINFSIASSSAIVSTSTYIVGYAPLNMTCFEQSCVTLDGTTIMASLSDGTNYMTGRACTTTSASSTPSTNNTWSEGELIKIHLGTNTGVTGMGYSARCRPTF